MLYNSSSTTAVGRLTDNIQIDNIYRIKSNIDLISPTN